MTISASSSPSADEKFDAEISKIITQLKHNDPDARLLYERAVRAIRKEYSFVEDVDRLPSGEYGPRAKQAIPKLIELLKSFPEGKGWSGLRNGFAAIGPDAAPALQELLRGENATWRERAAITFGGDMSRGRRKPLSAVLDLITAIRDKEQTVRFWAIRALGQIGPGSRIAVPAIASALKDEDAAVRREAGRALASIGPAAGAATPSLIEQLHYNDISTRGSAIYVLGRIGPDARAATGVIIHLLKDDILREEASVALGRIGVTGQHVPALIEIFSHGLDRSRQLAALNLARVGPDAKPAVAALAASLQKQPIREFAIHALGRIGPDAKQAVPELIKLLTNDSYFIRAGAAEALGRIGPGAKTAVPALMVAGNDTNALARRHAEEALRKIVPRGGS